MNKPLIVKAYLSSGFVSKFPWSPSLDGILAYQYRLNELGIEKFIETKPHLNLQEAVFDLPIEAEHYQGDWWYQCSMPIYHQITTANRYYHRRFNAQEAEDYMHDKKTKIETTKGEYKNARLIANQRITDCVEWYCIGNKDDIENLLQHITHIGARTSAGFGQVQEWQVTEGGRSDKARLYRPLPLAFAEDKGITGLQMSWAIRPPLQLPEHQRLCVIPYEQL